MHEYVNQRERMSQVDPRNSELASYVNTVIFLSECVESKASWNAILYVYTK